MNIIFPHDKPAIYTLNGTVAFPAIIDGHNVSCEVDEDALMECFGGRPPEEGESRAEHDIAMIHAFEAARERIEEAAAHCLREKRDQACVLRLEDFIRTTRH